MNPNFQRLPERALDPDFVRSLDVDAKKALREAAPGIWTGQVLDRVWIADLAAAIRSAEADARQGTSSLAPPNGMHRYGFGLEQLGFGSLLEDLRGRVVGPLARLLLADVGGADLDQEYGFIVDYGLEKDRDLKLHVDDSEVTLNIGLETNSDGGDMFFRGRRCGHHLELGTDDPDDYLHEAEPGVVVLHAGKHRHGTQVVTGGRRSSLVLWCRSSRHREAHDFFVDPCPDWCGVDEPQV